jgi:hypothetical protein
MFLTSRMNFMVIGHDLRFYEKRLGLSLAIFGIVYLSTPKFSPRSVRYADKLAAALFLHGESEKYGLGTTC